MAWPKAFYQSMQLPACVVGQGAGRRRRVCCSAAPCTPPDPADERISFIWGPGHDLAATRPGIRLSCFCFARLLLGETYFLKNPENDQKGTIYVRKMTKNVQKMSGKWPENDRKTVRKTYLIVFSAHISFLLYDILYLLFYI